MSVKQLYIYTDTKITPIKIFLELKEYYLKSCGRQFYNFYVAVDGFLLYKNFIFLWVIWLFTAK